VRMEVVPFYEARGLGARQIIHFAALQESTGHHRTKLAANRAQCPIGFKFDLANRSHPIVLLGTPHLVNGP